MPYPKTAKLEWNEQGTPVSRTFDDIYFTSKGLEEARYVFLNGNNLLARFHHHPRDVFVVGETGFGTGLNFLALWQAFEHFRCNNPQATLQRLHVISVEKFPFTAVDLAAIQARWTELAPWARQLQAQWPVLLPSCQRLLFNDGCVTLDLWLNDINQFIACFDDRLHRQVDAWFLDGFAPTKNPEMWTPQLFSAVAQLTRQSGSFATITSAGFVQRGLRDAGFSVTRRKGFGEKREMLVGSLNDPINITVTAPWYYRPAAVGEDIAIIGGGIASAILAVALLRRNKRVTLYCADDAPARGASGNQQAALYPLLNYHDATLNSFFSTAFTFARRYYGALPSSFEHQWCGVTQLGWDEKSRVKINQLATMELPPELARIVDCAEAESLTQTALGCGGITYPLGGWLSPKEVTTTLMQLAIQQGLQTYWQHSLQQLVHLHSGWRLIFANGKQFHHQNVVLATGHALATLPQSAHLPVYPVAGQVSHVPSQGDLRSLKQVLCYKGYVTPASSQSGTHSLGASYRYDEIDTGYHSAEQQENRNRLIRCLPTCHWPQQVDISANVARCCVRCASRDHLPMVGALPDYQQTLVQYAKLPEQRAQHQAIANAPLWPQLFVLGALGSRGMCSAPLAAEILAAQLCNEPIPLDATTLSALNPNRYWIRKLLKGKKVE